MPPAQNPQPGGQQDPQNPPAVDLSNIEKMIGDLNSSVETKLGEMDQKVTDLSQENATLKQYLADAASGSQQPQPQPGQPGWKPQSWDDFPQLVEQKASEIVDQRFQKAQEEAQKSQSEQARVQQEIDREIDNQLDTLTKNGILPAVQNERDPNDPGNQARKELLALGVALETPNLEQVAHNVLVPQHQAGNRFDAQTGTWIKSDPPLAGRYAPVGSSSNRGTTPPSGPDYKTIHNANSMDDLVAYADQHGYGPAPTQA